MHLGGKKSGVISSILPLCLIFFSNELKTLALQLPYGGMSKSLLQAPEHGPHPFMSRFMDRASVSSQNNNNNNNNSPAQKSKLLNRLRRKNMQVENPPKSRLHQQQRKSIQGERENFVNPNEGKEEIEGLLAMQDLAAMDRMLEEELNYAQQLANGIIVDLKTILGDMRKGEAEFAEGVNPELRSTIEKAIVNWAFRQLRSSVEKPVEVPDQERLLRLS